MLENPYKFFFAYFILKKAFALSLKETLAGFALNMMSLYLDDWSCTSIRNEMICIRVMNKKVGIGQCCAKYSPLILVV